MKAGDASILQNLTSETRGVEVNPAGRKSELASLERVLTAGPFNEALRAAIKARGLSLDRIRARLTHRGMPISLAALSHWQSGRSQPERGTSLDVLAALEDILELAPNTLAALLEPPRRRGRRASGDPVDLLSIYHNKQAVLEALRRFDTTADAVLDLSSHDRVVVGPDRLMRSVWNCRVLRAREDGPDHVVVVYAGDADNTPTITGIRGCTLGDVVTDPEAGLVVADLLFGHPLRQGEFLVLEHRVDIMPPYVPDTRWERRLPRPIREFVLEVEFTDPAIPIRCTQITAPTADSDDFTERLVRIDEFGRASAVALDLNPCRLGMQWEWEA